MTCTISVTEGKGNKLNQVSFIEVLLFDDLSFISWKKVLSIKPLRNGTSGKMENKKKKR